MDAVNEIIIIAYDGAREDFDLAELQRRLFGCFVAAGRQDSAANALDIALAVEFYLVQNDRPQKIFGRGEVDASICKMLEAIGYADVAQLYSHGDITGNDHTTMVNAVSKAELQLLLHSHIGCSQMRFERIIDKVAEAMQKLGINEAEPMLLRAVARHYEREIQENQPVVIPVEERRFQREDWLPLLKGNGREMVENGILSISGIDSLFPSIRFYFSLYEYAVWKKWSPPVTELEICSDLACIGEVIETVRTTIEQAYGRKEPLPCLLTLPDMNRFLMDYMDIRWDGIEPVAKELADVILSEINVKLYKFSF